MNTLFISNIDYRVSKKCLYDLLVHAAPVTYLKYQSKIAFARYASNKELEQAYNALNGTSLYGRCIVIQKVEPRVTLEVICSSWCDIDYINRVFSKFGSCKCRKWKGRHYCVFRRQADAEKAVETMDRKKILGNEFFVQIVAFEQNNKK